MPFVKIQKKSSILGEPTWENLRFPHTPSLYFSGIIIKAVPPTLPLVWD